MVKNLKKSKTLNKRRTKKAFRGLGKNSAKQTRKTIEGKYRKKSSNTSSNTSSNSPKKTNNNRRAYNEKLAFKPPRCVRLQLLRSARRCMCCRNKKSCL